MSSQNIRQNPSNLGSLISAISPHCNIQTDAMPFGLTLQRLKLVGFLYTFTSQYTRKHTRLMNFYKTFTTKNTFVSLNDSIRLMSKPIYIFCFKSQYYLNFYILLIYQLLNYVVDRNYQIYHCIYQDQNCLNYLPYSLLRKQNTYPFEFLYH